MILRVPSYYKAFRCIADKCKDSCCIGWEIDIDEDTFSYYKSVEGSFGEKLREHMISEDVNSFVLEENGWCPFLNEKKLCEICIRLGEEALSEVCTEYPRFTVEYGNVREKALCLSCEEVGRLVFSSDAPMTFEELELPDVSFSQEAYEEEEEPEEETCEVSLEFREGLENVRDRAIAILQNRSLPMDERICQYLQYCMEVQKIQPSETDSGISRYEDFKARMEVYEELEVLNEEWVSIKEKLMDFFAHHDYEETLEVFMKVMTDREYEYEHLMVYFTYRYFMKAWYDGNVLAKAQFAVASYLMIRDMDVVRYFENGRKYSLEDRILNTKAYAKEVEHSEDNLDMLADAFAFEPVFHVDRMQQQVKNRG